MNKIIFAGTVVFVLSLLMLGCKKDMVDNSDNAGIDSLIIKSFEFLPSENKGNLSDTVSCIIRGDTITGYYPLNTDATKLIATIKTGEPNVTVTVNNIKQEANTVNDFTKTITYTLTAQDSTTQVYTVVLKKFTSLPIVYINTGDQTINSKDIGVNGTFSIDSNNASFASYSGNAAFYIHGNTTATYPKLPYKIKLSSIAALLGMPAEKKWILLANYDDRTLIRNYIAFRIAQMFDMFYTPRSQFVELVLNGDYVGNYELTEQIDIDKNRLNINEMDDDDISGKALTGGYLVEGDNKREDDDHMRFTTSSENNSFVIHDPGDSIPQQTTYISDYFNNAEAALYGADFKSADDGYRKYIDPESFAEYFWVNELSRNNDAGFWSSTYLYKDKDSLLNMGPVWDFDLAFGNTTYNNNQNPQGWWLSQSPWFDRLLQDSSFVDDAVEKWQSAEVSLDSLPGIIDDAAASLDESEKENFKRWDILTNSSTFGDNITSETAGSYQGEIDFMKDWISERKEWIDANLQTLYQKEQ